MMVGALFAGQQVMVSPYALVPPKPAVTDDMRSMVEVLERFGEVRQVPGAYRVGGTLVVHPRIAEALRRQL